MTPHPFFKHVFVVERGEFLLKPLEQLRRYDAAGQNGMQAVGRRDREWIRDPDVPETKR